MVFVYNLQPGGASSLENRCFLKVIFWLFLQWRRKNTKARKELHLFVAVLPKVQHYTMGTRHMVYFFLALNMESIKYCRPKIEVIITKLNCYWDVSFHEITILFEFDGDKILALLLLLLLHHVPIRYRIRAITLTIFTLLTNNLVVVIEHRVLRCFNHDIRPLLGPLVPFSFACSTN